MAPNVRMVWLASIEWLLFSGLFVGKGFSRRARETLAGLGTAPSRIPVLVGFARGHDE